MALDPVTNFGKVTVSGTYNASETAITLSTGDGAKLPNPAVDGAFNLTWWDLTIYSDPTDDPNVEIVRCTARSTDALTVTRAQEGTSASTKSTAGSVYKMTLSITKKMIDDIESQKGNMNDLADDTTPQLGGNLDMNGKNIEGVTPTEMGYVSGVSSAIQTQLNAKGDMNDLVDDTAPQLGGNLDVNGNNVGGVTPTELGYVSGVTSAIQTQLGNKAVSGANSDITSLSGLTTPLSIAQGGTSGATKTAAMDALSPTTTKGDIVVDDGANVIRLAVGSNDEVLMADSGEASGVKWGVVTSQGNSKDYVLFENVTQGDPVRVINDSGTAKAALVTASTLGSETVLGNTFIYWLASAFDETNGKVVVVYNDYNNSEYGTAAVGTISGNTISYGTPVVFASVDSKEMSICFDSTNDKVIIAYRNDVNDYGYAVVGTVSGTSISFGTPVAFESATVSSIDICWDSVIGRAVIAYVDAGNSSHGTAIVGTVSGTAISFGTAVVFEAAATAGISCCYDSTSEKVIISYDDFGNSTYGTAIVGTVSGTSISFGTAAVFRSATTGITSCVYDTANNKTVVAYVNEASSLGEAIVGTVVGTDITFGTEVVFNSGQTSYVKTAYDIGNEKIAVFYTDNGNSSYATLNMGGVNGTNIVFSGEVEIDAVTCQYNAIAYDSINQKLLLAYSDDGDSDKGISKVYDAGSFGQATGIVQATGTTGQTKAVVISGGISTIHSFAATDFGKKMYIQSDKSIAKSVTPYEIGRCLDATDLVIF